MASSPNRPTDFSAPGPQQDLNPGSTANATHPSDENNSRDIVTDVLIIGGGFGGMYGVYRMRQLGLAVKLFKAGADFGGTWH